MKKETLYDLLTYAEAVKNHLADDRNDLQARYHRTASLRVAMAPTSGFGLMARQKHILRSFIRRGK